MGSFVFLGSSSLYIIRVFKLKHFPQCLNFQGSGTGVCKTINSVKKMISTVKERLHMFLNLWKYLINTNKIIQ